MINVREACAGLFGCSARRQSTRGLLADNAWRWRNYVFQKILCGLSLLLCAFTSVARGALDWDFAMEQKNTCSVGSMAEMNSCLADAYAETDRRLNKAYLELSGALLKPEPLKRSQLAWLRFRDLHCELHAPKDAIGSIVPYTRNACLINLTEKRILDFKQIVPCDGCIEFKPQYYESR
jgi:uncharacterized protein YecT (DUF1311 family)